MQVRSARFFLVVAAVLSVLAIVGSYLSGEGRWLHYLAKPTATLAVAGHVLAVGRGERGPGGRYRRAILSGLLCSLAGDVFLMLPGDYFVAGLVSFLLAHLCYLVGFTTGARVGARWQPFVAYLGVGAVVLPLLWPGVPAALRVPVVAYVAALLAMAAQAWVRARVVGGAARSAGIGGAWFVTSDAVLAWNRFRGPFPGAEALVLATYYVAQILIARSVSRSGPTPR